MGKNTNVSHRLALTCKGFWEDAYRWNRQAWICETCGKFHNAHSRCLGTRGHRPRMFTSLMDWLDPMVPVEWLADFLKVIHDCQNLDFLLLTKRPENWEHQLNLAWEKMTGKEKEWVYQWLLTNGREWLKNRDSRMPRNIWFGVTVENQAMADKRIPELLRIPAKMRWLSVEPLLESIDFGAVPGGLVSPIYQNRRNKIDWIVIGGESGAKRRDCGVEAIVNVAEQCKAAGVPCFVKQDCARKPGQQGRIPNDIWAIKQFPNKP